MIIFDISQSVMIGFIFYLRGDREARRAGRTFSTTTVGSREEMMDSLAIGTDFDDSVYPRPPSLNGMAEGKMNSSSKHASFDHKKKDKWFYTYSLRKLDCKYTLV
jgi:hypothetical protein